MRTRWAAMSSPSPAVVGDRSLSRWLGGRVRMAAIVSGRLRALLEPRWRRLPETELRRHRLDHRPAGEVVAATSPAALLAIHRIDVATVRRAQAEDPCHVEE